MITVSEPFTRAEHRPGRRWRESRFSGMMSVGFNTRTEDRQATFGEVSRRCVVEPWRALQRLGCALAGAPTWPFWPGAVRHVQRETLKAYRPVSLAGVELPAAGLSPAMAFNSPPREFQP